MIRAKPIISTIKRRLGQMSGYRSPYPTVEKVTTTNQKASKMVSGRELPRCRCCTPQALMDNHTSY